MFESYIPEKFCREFVEIKGYSGQLALIMAVIKGIKPCMDDWVSMDKYDSYLKICGKYGLCVMPDAVFKMVSRSSVEGNIIGSERLVTTIALGQPFDRRKNSKNLSVHVFISRSKENLRKCFEQGWYPLIIDNRLIEKPLVDNFKFGYRLGYPSCCVDFFHKYNNWFKYSYLFEAFRNTKSKAYNYLCNPFLKNSTYSYIYHMPCAYDCPQTAELAKDVRAAICEEDPLFAHKIDRHLTLPVLVFYETRIYAFEGSIKGERLYYKNFYYTEIDQENDVYGKDLQKGDCLFIDNRSVVILKKGRPIKKICCKRKAFAAEHPFLVQFK